MTDNWIYLYVSAVLWRLFLYHFSLNCDLCGVAYNSIIENLDKHIARTSLYGAYSPLDWQKKILAGELTDEKLIDTDKDALPDWEEIDTSKLIMHSDGSFDLPTINDLINIIENETERESILNFLYDNIPVSQFVYRTYVPSLKNPVDNHILSKKILPTKSDPTTGDSDHDGYCDVEDPDPINAPEYLDGEYDFLDGDVYYLKALDSVSEDYIKCDSTSAVMSKFTENDNQKFKFEWCGNGYRIHCFNDASLMLTVAMNMDGSGTVSPQKRTNLTEQLWEVVPYVNKDRDIFQNERGLVIRSKAVYYNKNDNRYESLYLSYKNGKVEVLTNRALGARFKLENVADWLRFGSIYTDGLGWTNYTLENSVRALNNYSYNNNIGVKTATESRCIYSYKDPSTGIEERFYINPNDPVAVDPSNPKKSEISFINSRYNDVNWTTAPTNEDYSNIYNELDNESCKLIGNYNLLQNQYGGNFPKMRYAELNDSKNHQMDYVCCEIIAAYNMLAVSGIYDIKDSSGNITNDLTKYSKLCAEFEYNNLMYGKLVGTGIHGSRPSGIANCLKSYNVKFSAYNFESFMDTDIRDAKTYTGFGIISTVNPIFSNFISSDFWRAVVDELIPYGGIHTYFVFYDKDSNKMVGINRASNHLKGWREDTISELIGKEKYLMIGYLSKKYFLNIMKKKKAIYLCSFLIFAVLIGFAIVIIFNCKNRDSIKTEMYVLSQRHGYFPGAYEYDGELYSRSVDGIVKYNENKEKTEIIKVDSEFFDYTISNNRIYLVSFGDGTAFLSTFSMSGEPLSKQQKLPVESLSMIGVVDNYLIGNTSTEKDKRIFKVFDMEHGLKETDITLSEYAEKSREYCSYGFDFILASLENDGYFVYNNDFIKSSSERYLAANDKYFAYVYNIVSPTIEFLDIDSGEIKKINNSQLYPYSKVVFSHLDGDILTVSFSQNSPNFWDDNNLLEGTNKLKYHRYDAYAVINLKTGKVVKKHKFDTYERIIFINDEKIITYKDGKYIEYSADSFKKISEQDASEIKADGRYIFYSHNNYIFIFDDNTGEMINRISAL